MQYKIPQNVRREDQIVGPLTLKQLVIAGAGGGIGYAIWVGFEPYVSNVPALMMAAVIWLLTVALIFLKINGIDFSKWILLMVEFRSNPTKRTYMMGGADVYSATLFKHESKKPLPSNAQDEASIQQEKINKLSEITKMVDTTHIPPQPL